MTQILVTKRDGRKEPLDLEKMHRVVFWATRDISGVSASELEIKSHLQFYSGIKTSDIQETLIKSAADLISEEAPNYQYVAGKQRLSMLRKDVYGAYDPPRLYDIVKKNVGVGLYTPELLKWYSEEDWNKMDDMLDHEKDEQYSYAAIEQLIEKYLVRNRATKEIYETPQIRYMVAAATVFHKEEPNSARMRYIKEYYNAASDGLFTLATPVLAGLGTPTKQLS